MSKTNSKETFWRYLSSDKRRFFTGLRIMNTSTGMLHDNVRSIHTCATASNACHVPCYHVYSRRTESVFSGRLPLRLKEELVVIDIVLSMK